MIARFENLPRFTAPNEYLVAHEGADVTEIQRRRLPLREQWRLQHAGRK